jgi:hypothetical protein
MQPASLPLDIYRGDSKRLQVKLWAPGGAPVDLTDAVAKSQIRDRPGGKQIIDLLCTITLPNVIDILLTSRDSHKLPAKGVWDLQITYPSGDVSTALAGPVTVTTDVTDSTDPYVEHRVHRIPTATG